MLVGVVLVHSFFTAAQYVVLRDPVNKYFPYFSITSNAAANTFVSHAYTQVSLR